MDSCLREEVIHVRDHPMIESLEATGLPTHQQGYKELCCPLCGEAFEQIYLADGEPVGCDVCVDTKSAEDWGEGLL